MRINRRKDLMVLEDCLSGAETESKQLVRELAEIRSRMQTLSREIKEGRATLGGPIIDFCVATFIGKREEAMAKIPRLLRRIRRHIGQFLFIEHPASSTLPSILSVITSEKPVLYNSDGLMNLVGPAVKMNGVEKYSHIRLTHTDLFNYLTWLERMRTETDNRRPDGNECAIFIGNSAVVRRLLERDGTANILNLYHLGKMLGIDTSEWPAVNEQLESERGWARQGVEGYRRRAEERRQQIEAIELAFISSAGGDEYVTIPVRIKTARTELEEASIGLNEELASLRGQIFRAQQVGLDL
ncbi:TPA: hypothetical protein DD449_03085 [Candidatus Berkelbacteria bacterium]|uniref:Uncharacterized protein n=1 Tax=Berkelbacteria bacterium GW2011_GWE1_39_12 TaxID=1618337 RepID=A0A0G4B4Y5_9BACT|nr:MAG: hypothetical protein UT28_C0001G0246 [Berkelbacteria bacterium GW2011_GWE1_39_12]HBO60642.1 hypothetical protein [Candidatus Berkelbacteria bacterium]